METAEFLAASRLVIVAGKGGVGKTTVSATLAMAAARSGLAVQLLEIEGKSGLSSLFGREALAYDDAELAPGIRGRTITPDEALLDYLKAHGLSRVSKRLVSSGALEIVATAAPGIRDILVLGKVKQLEQERSADLLVLDAPAAGHAITFLLAARALLDTVGVGPINAQARDVLELLTDPARCQVMLVTLPEETPVNELIDTAYHLEDRVGVSLGPVVVNGVVAELPGLDTDPEAAAEAGGVSLRPGEAESMRAAAAFRAERRELQVEQVARLSSALPLPQIHLPFLFGPDLGSAELGTLTDAFTAGITALETVSGP
ncbi:MAG: P-loop NTPase [Actinomycetota bacterium]|nr:P-loop NTPase [Acidimicrobiia bacterium]MDQ3293176.1 P-loop NTPase [Actinomycetota bacterium]